jgi:hypothetical protein
MSEDTVSVTLVKNNDHSPRTISDGTLLIENLLVSKKELLNQEDGDYYFALFAKDSFGNISLPAYASVTVDAKPTVEKLIESGEVEHGELTITQNIETAIVDPQIGTNASSATLNIRATYRSEGTQLGVGEGAVGNILLSLPTSTWADTGTEVKIGVDGGTGTVTQTDGNTTLSNKLEVGVDGQGTVTLSGGRFTVTEMEVGDQGVFDFLAGVLHVNKFIGDLINQGGEMMIDSVTPMTVTGDYSQLQSATVTFILKETNPSLIGKADDVSQTTPLLGATGTTIISGTVKVRLDGYVPKAGDKIVFVGKTQVSSMRTSSKMNVSSGITFDLQTLDSRLSWDTSSFDTDGTISVVSSGTGAIAGRPLNYPNPFKLTDGTFIGYWLNGDMDVELRVYTTSGSEVYRREFASGTADGGKSGYNRVTLNRSELGDLPSGVYPYVLINNGSVIGKGKLGVLPN